MAAREKLRLASFDGGGARSISQLEIMKTIMHRLRSDKYPNEPEKIMLPCEHFDMIGGSDTGGLIAIMFTKLRMSVKEATEEFCTIYGAVYNNTSFTPSERSGALRQCTEDLLTRRGLPIGLELVEKPMDGKCAGFVLATLCANVGHIVRFRTYPVASEPPSNITVVEAVLATCSSQPAFAPVSLGTHHEKQEYVGAALGANNPVREVLSEAHLLFGGGSSVASLLSIGSGHVGVVSMSPDGHPNAFNSLLQDMAWDCEKRDREMQEQIGPLGIYFRFSVEQGMQNSQAGLETGLSWMVSQSSSYVDDPKVCGNLDVFIRNLDAPIRLVTLEQLKHTGGPKAIYKTSPMLATHYIRRPGPWAQLVQAAISNVPEQVVVVIAGMAGCGKTQLVADLAREYNPERNTYFKYAFFVDGSSEASIKSDLVAHVQLVRPSKGTLDMDDVKNFFQNPRNGRWLIVFDNVDDTTLPLSSFFPRCDHGTIVVTTRNQALSLLTSRGLHLELDVMSESEATEVLLLCARIDRPSDEEKRSALAIAEKLGYLPVALSQAGCYMHEARCSGEAYLVLLENHRPTLMSRPSHTRQMDCAYAAFDISYQKLPVQLQNLVHLLSFFHFANFPDAIVPHAAKGLFLDDPFPFSERDANFEAAIQLLNEIFLPNGVWSDFTLPEMARVLRNYSIISITSTPTTNLWRIHPLMREWAFDCLPKGRRTVFRDAACRLLACSVEALNIRKYLPPHISTVVERPSDSAIRMNDAVTAGKILYLMGHPQAARDMMTSLYNTLRREYGPNDLRLATLSLELAETCMPDYCQAEELQRDATRIRMELLGPDAIEVLQAQNMLSRVLIEKKELPASQLLIEIVLKGFQTRLGDTHLDTLDAKFSLAKLYMWSDRYPEAVPLLREVLDERRSQLGENHMRTLDTMHGLADAYFAQSRHSEAEELLLAVLEGQRTQLSEWHGYNLGTMELLVVNYMAQDRLVEAEALQVKVLEGRRAQSGGEHLETLHAMEVLASIVSLQGRYTDAVSLRSKALQGRQSSQGELHLDTIKSMETLAMTYFKQGRFLDAEPLASKVLAMRTAQLGETHLSTLNVMESLGSILLLLGRYSEAESIGKKVVEIRKMEQGETHPETLRSMRSLVHIYTRQEDLSSALMLDTKLLEILTSQLGEVHADTLTAMDDLAYTYDGLCLYSDAEELRFRILEIQTKLLGEGHSGTLTAMDKLARTHCNQGSYLKAEPLQLKVLEGRMARLGEEHEDTIEAMASLASTYFRTGRFIEAEPLCLKIFELRTALLGAAHADTLSARSNLAVVYYGQGRYSEAEPLQVKLVEIQKEVLGERATRTLHVMGELACTFYELGRRLEAESIWLEVLKSRKIALGETHPDTMAIMSTLGSKYEEQGRISDAVTLYTRLLKAQIAQLGESHGDTLESMKRLALLHYQQGGYSHCEALEIKILESCKRRLGEMHLETLAAMASLAITYIAQERYSEAEPLQIKLMEGLKNELGEVHEATLLAMNRLSQTYYHQDRFSEAEPLKVKVLEIGTILEGEGSPAVAEYAHSLALTYVFLGRMEEAEALVATFQEALVGNGIGEDHPRYVEGAEFLALLALLRTPSRSVKSRWHRFKSSLKPTKWFHKTR